MFEHALRLPHCKTNNEAEYEGAILAVKTALDKDITEFLLQVDSKLIVDHFYGHYGTSNISLSEYLKSFRELASNFSRFKISWIPRKENKRADFLCRKILQPEPRLAREKVFPSEENLVVLHSSHVGPIGPKIFNNDQAPGVLRRSVSQ